MTTTTTNLRVLILVVALLLCAVISNALRPVHGQAQEDDLKKQVETLSKTVEEQKNLLNSLRLEHEKFEAEQKQWDTGTNTAIQNLNAWTTNYAKFKGAEEQWAKGANTAIQTINTRLTDYVKFRAAQEPWNKRVEGLFVQQGNAIQTINARLARARIP